MTDICISRSLKHGFRAIVAALMLCFALPLAACVGNGDQNVVIIQNNAPNADCTVSASVESLFYASGAIEFDSTVGYFLTPVAQNFAVADTEDQVQRRIAFVA